MCLSNAEIATLLGIPGGERTINLYPAFFLHRRRGFFWFRIFGYGFSAKDLSRGFNLLYEREGAGTFVRVRTWRVELLHRLGRPRKSEGASDGK